LSDRLHDYSSRSGANGNADTYFKKTYNKFYEKIIDKPYKNYGIYLTPIDLFGLDLKHKINSRILIPFERLKNAPTVIQVGYKVNLLTNQKDIDNILSLYSNKDKIEKIINTSKLAFIKLPQIVYFGDEIRFSHKDIETQQD
jgi:hypothetical protein